MADERLGGDEMNEKEGPLAVSFNLFTLKRGLETRKQRKYTWLEISDKSGLSTKTLQRMEKGQYKRIDFSSIAALLNFFENEDMPIGVEDLFVVSRSKPKK